MPRGSARDSARGHACVGDQRAAMAVDAVSFSHLAAASAESSGVVLNAIGVPGALRWTASMTRSKESTS